MCSSGGRHNRAGMTLIEIMIVVTIIGILAVIAIPNAMRARMRSQNTAFVNDLRVISGEVFDYYSFEYGDFPPDAAPGVEPAGVSNYMPRHLEWSENTAIGGLWDWDRAPDRNSKIYGVYAGLSVYQPQRTVAEMEEIDGMVDDGDLSTGLFRSRPSGYIYIMEY